MRFFLLICTTVILAFLVACQPVKNAIDIQNVLSSQSGADVSYDERSNLLKIIKDNPNDENGWKALHYYSSLTDAGATLMFYRDCFMALKSNPLIFFDRYMAGDEQALFRMVDALSHDFSAFSEEKFQDTDQVFEKVFDEASKFMRKHSQERAIYRRALDFDRVSRAQYDSWRLRYDLRSR
jgi:hypothetical protein